MLAGGWLFTSTRRTVDVAREGFHVREFGFRGLPIARPAIIRELPFLDKLAIIGNPCAEVQIGGEAGVVHNPVMG